MPTPYIKEIMAKQKLKPTDGLGPLEIKKIRSAIRLVWQRCHARKLVVKRCTGRDGFTHCEKCKRRTPSLKVDHTKQVGDVDGGFIVRLFVPSIQMRGLCSPCHDLKTQKEKDEARLLLAEPTGVSNKRKKKRNFTDDY